jgi:hypothetical protein
VSFDEESCLIRDGKAISQGLPTMGQQTNKIIKRRRRADYLKRKNAQAKLGGIVKKPAVKKVSVAKKAPAKKVAAKKAPAKKAAKKVATETKTKAPAKRAATPKAEVEIAAKAEATPAS